MSNSEFLNNHIGNYLTVLQGLDQLKEVIYRYLGEAGSDILKEEVLTSEYTVDEWQYKNHQRWLWVKFKVKRDYLNHISIGFIHRDNEMSGRPQVFIGMWFKTDKLANVFYNNCDDFDYLEDKGEWLEYHLQENKWKNSYLIWAELTHNNAKSMLEKFDSDQLKINLNFLKDQIVHNLNQFDKIK